MPVVHRTERSPSPVVGNPLKQSEIRRARPSGAAIRRAAPIALAAAGLVSCTVGPTYRRPGLDAPVAWQGADADLGTQGERGDLSAWWTRFDDPALSALVESAVQQNLDLRSARARLRQARARVTVAGAARLPELGASAQASHAGSTATPGAGDATGSSQVRAGLDASWQLDLFGGARRGVEAAEADYDSAAASLDAARVALVAEVARTYVEIGALRTRLDIAERNLVSQTETLRLTEYRARAGLVTTQDVEQARASQEQTRASIPTLERSRVEAEHRLDLLLGELPGATRARLGDAAHRPTVPAQVAVGIPAETLRQRPDVRAAERTLAAETARVGVAEAARYPSLTLSGSIGIEALQQGAVDGTGLFYTLVGGLTAPIWDAGRRAAAVEAQDAVREEALARYELVVLTAVQQVEDALVALARSRERHAALARAADAARAAAALARQRYEAGLIDFQPVLDTERTVLSVEDSLATSEADEVQALIRLYEALGGGWAPIDPSSDAEDDA